MNVLHFLALIVTVGASTRPICTIDVNFKVEPELIETAFESWNKLLPLTDQLLYTGTCSKVWSTVGSNGLSTISFKRMNYSVGSTVSYSNNDDRDINLDAWKIHTAASLYNVLLHELGHVIGLHHPRPYDPYSVMGYTIGSSASTGNVVQDHTYIVPTINDVLSIQAIYTSHLFNPTKTGVPSIPPGYVNIYIY